MIDYADVVCGLAWGDEAKGKITASLASSKEYDYVCRWAGGSNAGHTVYVDGKKYKTHLIPSGIFFGVKCVIGPACVINERKFYEEIGYLQSHGFDTSLIKISPRAHVVTEEHISKDKNNLHGKLGTTGSGIAPCYSAKAGRVGILARNVFPQSMMWDEKLSGNILCEGAQGAWLDMDWGNYPYVTSSTTLPYGACSLGIPMQKIRKIYGASKVYDTRSGVDPAFPENLLENPDLLAIADAGLEFGVTTGRRRKVNWLDLDKLIESINLSGVTHVVVSKEDVLVSTNLYKLFFRELLREFTTIEDMKSHITFQIHQNCSLVEKILFSSSPHSI